MRKLFAYILFTIFFGFLLSISTHFSLYMKVLNGGSMVEDINSMPEEHSEHGINYSKLTAAFHNQRMSRLMVFSGDTEYFLHQTELLQTFYPEVPSLPPERI